MSPLVHEKDGGAGRRKVLAGIGILVLIALRVKSLPAKKRIVACAPPSEKKTIRVLSQDGRLMEIDAANGQRTSKKISDTELQEWVRRK